MAFRYGLDQEWVPLLCGLVPVAAGYPDQALHGATGRSPWPGSCRTPSAWLCPGLCGHAASFRREGAAAQERAEAVIMLSREKGFVLVLAMRDSCEVGRLPARTRGGGNSPDTPGIGRCQGHGVRARLAMFSAPARRGIWEAWGSRGRIQRGDRGAGNGAQNRGALVGGRAVSAQGGAVARSYGREARRRRKAVFIRPSTSPAASRRNPWSCARP